MNREPPTPNRSLVASLLGSSDACPYPSYAVLRASQPICRDASGTWLVSTHELILKLLRDHDAAFQTVPLDEDVIGAHHAFQRKSGDDHTRLRSAMSALFSGVSGESLRASIDREARALLRAAAAVEQFDLANVALALSLQTVCNLLGIPRAKASAWLMACAPAARSIAAPQLDPGSRDALKPGVDEFAALVRDFIDEVERDAMPQHPLRGLLQLQAQHVLSRVELVDNVAFMFIAGFATTTRAIGNTVVQLLRHRWLWDACGADRSIVPKAIREMLRLDGVAHGVVRYARHDIELGGHLIRRGDEVMLLLASANHDAHVFPEPQKVELSRPSAANLAFGAGAHACIGRMVAMLEIEAVVRAMLDTMPHVTLVEQRTRWQQHGLVQGYAQIWLRHG